MPGHLRFFAGAVLAAGLLSSAHAAPTCAAQSPAAVAQQLQAEHYFFYVEPEPAAALLSPRLLKLLRDDAACTEREQGICAQGSDPWLDAQDGEMGQPLTFKETANDGTRAELVLGFPFVLDPEHPVQRQSLLQFVKTAGCWQLDDLQGPEQRTWLGEQLKTWAAQYGAAGE
ncbi:MAG: hypothetical protein ABWY06_22795 [Pseudomonas sp.]|uniref:hypothetical protein n=1 Tax=Pseudomonas sp. TaxID=306 RepID=UPI0033966DCE